MHLRSLSLRFFLILIQHRRNFIGATVKSLTSRNVDISLNDRSRYGIYTSGKLEHISCFILRDDWMKNRSLMLFENTSIRLIFCSVLFQRQTETWHYFSKSLFKITDWSLLIHNVSEGGLLSFITYDPALHPVSQRSNSLMSQLIYVRVAALWSCEWRRFAYTGQRCEWYREQGETLSAAYVSLCLI